MVVVAYAFYRGNCAGDARTALFSTAVNVSFFALFILFYREKYNKEAAARSKSGKKGSGSQQTEKGKTQ